MDIDKHGQNLTVCSWINIKGDTVSVTSYIILLYYLKYKYILIPLEFIAPLLSAEGKAKIGKGGRLKMALKNGYFVKL